MKTAKKLNFMEISFQQNHYIRNKLIMFYLLINLTFLNFFSYFPKNVNTNNNTRQLIIHNFIQG